VIDPLPHSEREKISAILADGQSCYYEPVYATIPHVSDLPCAKASTLEKSVSACFPDWMVGCYERVTLRWMKPDGKGGLVPR
jgi:hypothetical protein